MRLYTLTPESGAAVTVLRLSGVEAGHLAHALCVARGQGHCDAGMGIRVIVDNAPAQPGPGHEAIDER